ncbi:MAG: hypothetical protein ISS16_06735 [Ignavibacteria bacterium]|nr:hypothetical protein [Ignavibacteria bacterium]
MGITIHFQGKLKNTLLINSFKDELIDISEIMNWECQALDEDWSKPATAKLSKKKDGFEIVGHLPLKGVHINIHPDSEPLSLYFDAEGCLTTPILIVLINEGRVSKENSYNSVKTQFAPPDVHISIIKLLKYLKKRYIPNLRVVDEGEYWESDDKEKLIEKMDFLKDKMDMIEGILSSIDPDIISKCSSEQLAKILEERLKKYL